jgi:hypothetical protein
MTGPDEILALNFADSFGDLDKMSAGMAAGIAAHSKLAGLQDRLLAENVDALGSRAVTINCPLARLALAQSQSSPVAYKVWFGSGHQILN